MLHWILFFYFCFHFNLHIDEGRLEIYLFEGDTFVDENGKHCDNTEYAGNYNCDSFVIILIDGKEVARTRTIKEKILAHYNYEYVSVKPISKYSVIELQMWDEDYAKNDRMDTWIIKPEDIDGAYHNYYGKKSIRFLGYDRTNKINFRALLNGASWANLG